MDGFKILLDCGWNDRFDVNLLEPLAKVAAEINAVLISHPDTEHLGALPYAFGKLGMRCKVYATLPVHKMGLMFMYDHFLSRSASEDFGVFTLDDIDAAFSAFVPVRYAQRSCLDSDGIGITITPYAAGHMLGGALWKVHKETDDIVYAVNFNHRKEKHLNGTVLESLKRPDVLITDASNTQRLPPSKTRENDLIEAILRCVRQEGNVLIPIDPAGRVLELLLVLEEKWSQKQLGAYQLVLLTTVAYNTLEFARSHLEWMGEHVGRYFDMERQNAFNTRYLKLCHSIDDFRALPPGPKVVLASFGSLDAGASRHLFVEWAPDPRNLIVFTGRMQAGSLSREVYRLSQLPPGARSPLKVSLAQRLKLVGDELIEWQGKKREEMPGSQVLVPNQRSPAHGFVRDAKPVTVVCEPDSDIQRTTTHDHASSLGRQCHLLDGVNQVNSSNFAIFEDESWDPLVIDFGERVAPENFDSHMHLWLRKSRSCERIEIDPDNFNPAPAPGNFRADKVSIGLEEFPTKILTKMHDVYLRAAVHVCDFEGSSDGQSIQTILTHLEPRNVVLVRGKPSDTDFMRMQLQKSLVRAVIHAPKHAQMVECTSESTTYRLELSQDLLFRTRMRDMTGYQVGWVEGDVLLSTGEGSLEATLVPSEMFYEQLQTGLQTSIAASNPAVGEVSVQEICVIDKCDELSTAQKLHQNDIGKKKSGALVGSLKLSDSRSALAAAGCAAEFRGGALVCTGEKVCVRKAANMMGSEDLLLEGNLCEAFYNVRSTLYHHHQVHR